MFVLVFDSLADTCAAGVAVEEVPATSCLADPTVFAVKLVLRSVVVPQGALDAKVVPKCHITVDAMLGRALDGQTEVALDSFDILAVELVRDLLALALALLSTVQHVSAIYIFFL